MRWKLLPRALWRSHPVAVALTAAALVAIAGAMISTASSERGVLADDRPARLLLNRPWFDHYPESPRDEVTVWIWLAGGIGLSDRGTAWRVSYEVFEFERHGSQFEMRFLQDGEEARTRFSIESCDELPPFDLCLTLDASPRGPQRYYSFGGGDDLAAHIPWGPRLLESARARAAIAAP